MKLSLKRIAIALFGTLALVASIVASSGSALADEASASWTGADASGCEYLFDGYVSYRALCVRSDGFSNLYLAQNGEWVFYAVTGYDVNGNWFASRTDGYLFTIFWDGSMRVDRADGSVLIVNDDGSTYSDWASGGSSGCVYSCSYTSGGGGQTLHGSTCVTGLESVCSTYVPSTSILIPD